VETRFITNSGGIVEILKEKEIHTFSTLDELLFLRREGMITKEEFKKARTYLL